MNFGMRKEYYVYNKKEKVREKKERKRKYINKKQKTKSYVCGAQKLMTSKFGDNQKKKKKKKKYRPKLNPFC
jgi:hypothetical protein